MKDQNLSFSVPKIHEKNITHAAGQQNTHRVNQPFALAKRGQRPTTSTHWGDTALPRGSSHRWCAEPQDLFATHKAWMLEVKRNGRKGLAERKWRF